MKSGETKLLLLYNNIMSGNDIPKEFKKYFWSVDFDSLDINRSKEYIVFQLLEFGDEKAVRWLFETYKKNEIINVLKRKRGFSRKGANFWRLILGIPKDEMVCFNQGFTNQQAKIWQY